MFYKINAMKLDRIKSKEAKECIEFWSDMISLKECDFFNGIKIILNNLLKGYYKRYYTGLIGAFRDILYLLLKKLFNKC